jgi:c-di-GMP-binding flagellar brake protein YcgR
MLKALQETIRSPEPSKSKPDTGFQIRTREKMIPLLIQAHRTRLLFDVSIPTSETHYTTALLGVYDSHGFLVLDELTPSAGHKKLLKQRRMTLTGKLDGVPLRFNTRLIETRQQKGMAFYKVEMPESVFHMQRRQEFRITATEARIPFHAQREDDSQEQLQGYVFDLSRNGMGLNLEGEVKLERDDILQNCVIMPSGNGKIPFALKVCHATYHKKRKLTRIGGCFEEIDTSSQRRIAKIITQFEREYAKRLSGNG